MGKLRDGKYFVQLCPKYTTVYGITVCGRTVGGSNVFSSTVGEYGSVVYSRNRDDSTVYNTSEK